MVDAALKPVGSVDVAVIAFDEPVFNGEIAASIIDLVRAGIVRLLDAVMVHKAEDGTVTLAEITDIDGDGIPDLVALQGDIPGLIGEDDATSVIAEMPNDSAILMLAWENTWAIRTAAAIRANGGTLVALERIAAADVEAVLAAAED
ncbi:MAG: DUF6325 family protein [Candidatus Nanopelagicales bacterium]